MSVIYDIGSNNGDDVAYYLQKADIVVAVEAIPELSDLINLRFQDAIAAGRLIVENCVVTAGETDPVVPFYVSTQHHVLSQFSPPAAYEAHLFQEMKLPSRSLMSIVDQYGFPFYMKIDIEGYDHVLLKNLFLNKVFPSYISAESHNIDVFAAMVALGGYGAFKLVDGPSIPHVYGQHEIATDAGMRRYSFPDHSAGPFGNDIVGPWQSANSFFRTLAAAGLGWKDIHASRIDPAQV